MSRTASAEMNVKADKKPRATNCTWPLFTAISNVMMQAKKDRLEPEDLLSLPASDNVSEQSELLKKSWERTLRHFHRDQAAKKAEELANPEAAKKKKKKKGEELPSLTKALWPQVRGLWRVAFGLYLVSVGLAFLGPFLLGRTVQLLQTTQQCGLKEQQAAVELQADGNLLSDEPPSISAACRESSQIHLGYIYAAAMLCVKLCEALLRSWHDHLMTRLALRARAPLRSRCARRDGSSPAPSEAYSGRTKARPADSFAFAAPSTLALAWRSWSLHRLTASGATVVCSAAAMRRARRAKKAEAFERRWKGRSVGARPGALAIAASPLASACARAACRAAA